MAQTFRLPGEFLSDSEQTQLFPSSHQLSSAFRTTEKTAVWEGVWQLSLFKWEISTTFPAHSDYAVLKFMLLPSSWVTVRGCRGRLSVTVGKGWRQMSHTFSAAPSYFLMPVDGRDKGTQDYAPGGGRRSPKPSCASPVNLSLFDILPVTCSHPISLMLALSVDFLAHTLPILAPSNPFALPSVQICCPQFAVKARERSSTLAQTLWAGIRRSRLTCRVYVCPLHYCRASSSDYYMLEPTLLLKIAQLVPYLKEVFAMFRTCLWEVNWLLWESRLVPEGHMHGRQTWDSWWNRPSVLVSCLCLLLPACGDWEGWWEAVRRACTRAARSMASGDPNNGFLCRLSINVDFLTMLHPLCLLMATVTRFYLSNFYFDCIFQIQFAIAFNR